MSSDLVMRLQLPGIYGDLTDEAIAEIKKLTAERDAALKDAERYQWLKENCVTEIGNYGDLGISYVCSHKHFNNVDASIDDAMGEPR